MGLSYLSALAQNPRTPTAWLEILAEDSIYAGFVVENPRATRELIRKAIKTHGPRIAQFPRFLHPDFPEDLLEEIAAKNAYSPLWAHPKLPEKLFEQGLGGLEGKRYIWVLANPRLSLDGALERATPWLRDGKGQTDLLSVLSWREEVERLEVKDLGLRLKPEEVLRESAALLAAPYLPPSFRLEIGLALLRERIGIIWFLPERMALLPKAKVEGLIGALEGELKATREGRTFLRLWRGKLREVARKVVKRKWPYPEGPERLLLYRLRYEPLGEEERNLLQKEHRTRPYLLADPSLPLEDLLYLGGDPALEEMVRKHPIWRLAP